MSPFNTTMLNHYNAWMAFLIIPPQQNTRRSPKVGSMLDQRRRRWANIEPTMGKCLMFAGSISSNLDPQDVSSDILKNN